MFLSAALKGMNSNVPIKAWVAEDPEARIPPNDSGRPGKPLFLTWLCRRIWRKMPDFATMDAKDDTPGGNLSVECVQRCLAAFVGDLGGGEDIVLKALVSSACPGETAGGVGITEAAYLAARNQVSVLLYNITADISCEYCSQFDLCSPPSHIFFPNQPSGEQHGRDLLAKIHSRCAANSARE